MELDRLPGAWVLEAFRRGGVDLEELSRQLPEDVDTLLYHMDIITPEITSRLMTACAEISGKQDFGLRMNEWVDITMYGLFGYLLLNSGTVRDLFETLERYYLIHHDGGMYYRLSSENNLVSIQFGFEQPVNADPRHDVEWALGFIPHHLGPKLGELATPRLAQFSYAPPRNLDYLHSVFGNNLEFNQPMNRLLYDRSILEQRLVEVDLHLLKVLRERADNYLLEQQEDDSLRQKISMLLFEHLGNNRTNAEDIAEMLNMSLSTFKRKLAEEGIDFKKTKDTIKNELAKQLLTETSSKISDIAHTTGFTNQSSFTRFFIRCNQQKPREYRNSDKNIERPKTEPKRQNIESKRQ